MGVAKVSRFKLWYFDLELHSGERYWVGKRGTVWIFGRAGNITAKEESTSLNLVLCAGLGDSNAVDAIDRIVEHLVTENIELRSQVDSMKVEERKSKEP